MSVDYKAHLQSGLWKRNREALTRADVACLEPQIFGEVKGVGAAVRGRTVRDVTGVPAAQRRNFVTQRLLELARNDAAVGALTDQLLLERFVDALCVRAPGHQREQQHRQGEPRYQEPATEPARAGGGMERRDQAATELS